MKRSVKSIGIYGDSFTAGRVNAAVNGLPYHWSTLLQKYFSCELENYGAPGSSIYYSYLKFQENYHKHDVNIFLVTEPYRYTTPVTIDNDLINFTSLSTLDWHEESTFVNVRKKDLMGWFLASDPKFLEEMAGLMVEKINGLDTDCVMFPSFEDLPKKVMEFISPDAPCGMKLYNQQSDLLDIDGIELAHKYKENFDIVVGHLVPEFNQIMFDYLKNKIETGVWQCNIMPPDKLSYTIQQLYTRR